MIFFTFLILLLTIIFLFCIKSTQVAVIRGVSLFSSGFVLLVSSFLVLTFNTNIQGFQHVVCLPIGSNILNLNFTFGLDGVSLFFFFLSSFLVFLCLLFIWGDHLYKEYAICLLVIEIFLLIIFSVLDLFLFYIFFEAILIPMFLIVGVWGSRERKIRAAYLFFFYTLCGSVLMLLGILYIYSTVGTLNLEYLLSWKFSINEQSWLWLAFFISFASKIPMFPFHIWLPEAHVEAPTVGSVLLAGILLKLGVYGFVRFSLTLFPEASFYYSPFVYLIAIVGVIYASFTAIRQTDMKRIIAYSSIAHMNLVVLGIFCFNLMGLQGAILQSVSHGFVSGGLFLLVGVLYDRYHSRFVYYYGGLVHFMPIYAILFFIFTLSNIALPGTGSFVGEFLLLVGVFQSNVLACIISATGVVLCGTYSLWLYNRIVFGNLKIDYTVLFSDISIKEFWVLLPLLVFIFLTGLYPSVFSEYLHLVSGYFLNFNF